MNQLPSHPVILIVMGSKSDWECMSAAAKILDELQVPYEAKVASAHRAPDLVFDLAGKAEERGLEVVIAGAGGAAHLPGVIAGKTPLPVIGVPMQSKALNGMDSLLSIVQMPPGIPVATVGIGSAANAALLAAAILARKYPQVRDKLLAYRKKQTETVMANQDPRG